MVNALSIGNYVRYREPGTQYSGARQNAPVTGIPEVDWSDRTDARRGLLSAVRALDRLEQTLSATHRGASIAPSAQSSADIGLDTGPDTAASVTSSGK